MPHHYSPHSTSYYHYNSHVVCRCVSSNKTNGVVVADASIRGHSHTTNDGLFVATSE